MRKQFKWKSSKGSDPDEEEMPQALKEAILKKNRAAGIRKRDNSAPKPKPGSTQVAFEGVSWAPQVDTRDDTEADASVKYVFSDCTWHVRDWQKVGLIGANGCGKSTMLLMINGQIEIQEGEIQRHPKDMRIAYMKQEAELDGKKTVMEELLSVFADRPLEDIDADIEFVSTETDDASMDKLTELIDERAKVENNVMRVEKIIPVLGMEDRRAMFITDLSGGWQMRVALGKIILGDPDLILLDEPTNHIDLETVEFMEEFLRKQKVPMVIVSHDRYFLNRVCNKIVWMYKGDVKSFIGNYLRFLQKRDTGLAKEWLRYVRYVDQVKMAKNALRKLEAKMILDMAAQKRVALDKLLENPVPKPEVNEIKGFRFNSSVGHWKEEMQVTVVDGEEEEEEEEDDDFWGESDDKADAVDVEIIDDSETVATEVQGLEAPVLLEIKDVKVSFPQAQVLKGVSLKVRQGEKVALVGPNGCGKSTLVRAVVDDLGEDAEFDGECSFTDKGIAYFPQRLAEFFNYESGSVRDALYQSCSVRDIDAVGGLKVVLDRLRLDGVTASQPVSSLSGGEKARVAFASFLLRPVALLILDEPTNHLDIPTRELLEDALKEFTGAVLVVSHDRFFLREFATRVVELDNDGGMKDFPSWEDYSQEAPEQWAEHEEGEEEFIRQDARATMIWSDKKLSRLRKRENIGLRRLSSRSDDFVADEEAKKKAARPVPKGKQLTERLLKEGLDPKFIREHIPFFFEAQAELEAEEAGEVLGEEEA